MFIISISELAINVITWLLCANLAIYTYDKIKERYKNGLGSNKR